MNTTIAYQLSWINWVIGKWSVLKRNWRIFLNDDEHDVHGESDFLGPYSSMSAVCTVGIGNILVRFHFYDYLWKCFGHNYIKYKLYFLDLFIIRDDLFYYKYETALFSTTYPRVYHLFTVKRHFTHLPSTATQPLYNWPVSSLHFLQI